MHLAYVDESFNRREHWVVAVLIQDQLVNETQRAIGDVVAGFGLDEDTELHGYELFHGKGAFDGFRRQPRARTAMYANALRVLHECDARIVLRGVDKQRLASRYRGARHPHLVTMGHLLERVDEQAEHLDDLALVVADEHHETQGELLRELRTYQQRATWGYRSRQLRRIVDTIHFVRSDTNRLVQAADLVAFLTLRLATHRETDERAAAANLDLWSIIQPLVVHRHCWHP